MRPLPQQQHSEGENPGGASQMIDIISAIEELNGLSSQELNKLLKDSENFSVKYRAEKGSLKQINTEKLTSSLPLHLIASLLSPDRDMCLGHVLHGISLLHTLSNVATLHARLEQDNHIGYSPVLHSALVSCSLHLLTSCLSSQWNDLAHFLLAHPKGRRLLYILKNGNHQPWNER